MSDSCSASRCVRPAIRDGLCAAHSMYAVMNAQFIATNTKNDRDDENAKPRPRPMAYPDFGICEMCRKAFNKLQPNHKYCSVACRKHRPVGVVKSVTKTCARCNCAMTIVINGAGSTSKKFCDKCRQSAWIEIKQRHRRIYKARKRLAPVTGDVSIAQLRKVDGDNCHICCRPIDFTLPHSHSMSATVDHLIPLSLVDLNPWHGPGNVALAHRWCNVSKGNRRVDATRDAS